MSRLWIPDREARLDESDPADAILSGVVGPHADDDGLVRHVSPTASA